MRPLLVLLLLILPAVALSADLSRVRPKRLAREAVLSVTAPDGSIALATASGELWAGSGRLSLVADLDAPPSGLHLSGDALTAWSTRKAGLCIETRRSTWKIDGRLLHEETQGGSPIAIMAVSGQHALLWPARLDLVSVKDGGLRSIHLPEGVPVGLSLQDGSLVVNSADRPLLRVGLSDLCPQDLADDPALGPLARQRIRDARRICETPPHLPDEVQEQAKVEREARLRLAVSEGDTDEIARLGPLTCEEIERYRPAPADAETAFETRQNQRLHLGERLRTGGRVAVLRRVDPAMDLDPWVNGPLAPACEATLVLAAPTRALAGWLEQRLERLVATGGGCAGSVLVAAPGELSPPSEGKGLAVEYLDSAGNLLGVRGGVASPRMVRLDLARLDKTDPLHALAQAPELSPSWTVGPGPGTAIIQDVDGSWVAGAGWDLLRGPPNAIRTERVSLPGPIQRLQGRSDGRFEVVVGGQPGRVAFESREIEWAEAIASSEQLLPVPDPLPPRPEVERGPWRIVGDGRIAARTEKGNIQVETGLTIQRLINGSASSVLVTPLGLVGVDREGRYAWRLTEVDRWTWTGDFVVGTSPWGVHGFRIPL